MISPPLLSEYDPEVLSEGSLDPLGLYLIADRLATRLIPGFRERMRHPRFLTGIAVGSHVCSTFDEDEIASDDMSPPYQVYEWYVVQALVSRFKETDETIGLPGVSKAIEAYRAKVPLSATRYLKTPSVFGFHGVYRTLARDLDLITEYSLGDFGERLLRSWEKEQNLEGFYTGQNGDGKKLLNHLRSAVREGCKTGSAVKGWWWGQNKVIAGHLAPYRIGIKEGKVLLEGFLSDKHSLRKEVINYLLTSEGQLTWNINNSEREFHESLYKNGSGEMKDILSTIQLYEQFARLLQNAFDESLYIMSGARHVYINDLSRQDHITKASTELPGLFRLVSNKLSSLDLSFQFERSFGLFNEVMKPTAWIEILIEHHNNIQRTKSRIGKSPWFERTDNGRLLIYPGRVRSEGPATDKEYVHFYRTNSLWSFLRDMKLVTK